MARFSFGRNRRGGRGTNQYSVKPSTASSVDVDRLQAFPRSLGVPTTSSTELPESNLDDALAKLRSDPTSPSPSWVPEGVAVAAKESNSHAPQSRSGNLEEILSRSPRVQQDIVAASLRQEDLTSRLASIHSAVTISNDAIMRDVGW